MAKYVFFASLVPASLDETKFFYVCLFPRKVYMKGEKVQKEKIRLEDVFTRTCTCFSFSFFKSRPCGSSSSKKIIF